MPRRSRRHFLLAMSFVNAHVAEEKLDSVIDTNPGAPEWGTTPFAVVAATTAALADGSGILPTIADDDKLLADALIRAKAWSATTQAESDMEADEALWE